MNQQALKQLLSAYKENFHEIRNVQLYKWRAVKKFQLVWNIEAENFARMLASALSESENLLASTNYLPKRMIVRLAEEAPEEIRECFRKLFDENLDLSDRIASFKADLDILNSQHFPGKRHYQEDRTVFVYLAFRYPDLYFLYKYSMFQKIATVLAYSYQPRKGNDMNPYQFMNLCRLVLDAIKRDNNLLTMHQQNIENNCYADTELHLLTQDVVYSAQKYFLNDPAEAASVFEFNEVDIPSIIEDSKPSFKPRLVDFDAKQREAIRIGKLGEQHVFERECQLVKSYGLKKKMPIHVSVIYGDGLGYDILSYDPLGNEIFIEVKTTVGLISAPFYITRTELEASKKHPNKYWLYRLFKFDEKALKSSFFKRGGDLLPLCQIPSQYMVKLKKE